jgi:hypothetical protein
MAQPIAPCEGMSMRLRTILRKTAKPRIEMKDLNFDTAVSIEPYR